MLASVFLIAGVKKVGEPRLFVAGCFLSGPAYHPCETFSLCLALGRNSSCGCIARRIRNESVCWIEHLVDGGVLGSNWNKLGSW